MLHSAGMPNDGVENGARQFARGDYKWVRVLLQS